MLESRYKPGLHERIEERFPGAVILKTDPAYLQGVPDSLVLFEDHWGFLEVKRSANARRQPNQPYYVDLLNRMSFAAFIHPENEVEVLDALQYTWESQR